MTNSPDTIAGRIDALRQEHRLTWEQLALDAGMATKTLQRRMAAPSKFVLDEVIAIARVLDVDVEALLLPMPAVIDDIIVEPAAAQQPPYAVAS